jgi:integrase
MEKETNAGKGKVSYADYKRVIEDYLLPFFGNYNITSIDYPVIEEFEEWRIVLMGKEPTHSTLLTHNAAMNRVFDEAIIRGFLADSQRPKLETKGRKSIRRPSFSVDEIRKMWESFEIWIPKGRGDKSKELRALLRDYVTVLLDTGARPGEELMNLQWKQVSYSMKPTVTRADQTYTTNPDEPPEEEEFLSDPEGNDPRVARVNPNQVEETDLNRSCEMIVTGKTGTRQILGMDPTVKALARIILRNYGVKNKVTEPFKTIAVSTNSDHVFRIKGEKEKPTSFQNLFEDFLEEHGLLIDPKTGKKRVFYSLRHTYATLALTHDIDDIRALARHMGSSVAMIEKYYDHATNKDAIEKLRNRETRRLIARGSVIEPTITPPATSETESNTIAHAKVKPKPFPQRAAPRRKKK